MRRAARTDRNHRPLFDLAWALGGDVTETHQLGDGKPDGFVYAPRKGRWFAVEVKTDEGTLTPDQEKYHARVPVEIWRTEADVLRTLGITPRRHRSKVPAPIVVDDYQRCALSTCGKILREDRTENQRYCNGTCSNRARRLRTMEFLKPVLDE